jgi:hypothetical protein
MTPCSVLSYVSPHKRACRHQLPNCLLPFPWDCVRVVRHPPKGQRVLREFGRFGSSWLTVGRISLFNEMTNRVHKTDLVPVFKTLASGNGVRDSSPRQSFWFWRETAVKSQAYPRSSQRSLALTGMSGRGSGTKPSRFGIFTFGNVFSFSSTRSSTIPFKKRMYAVTEYASLGVRVPGSV